MFLCVTFKPVFNGEIAWQHAEKKAILITNEMSTC